MMMRGRKGELAIEFLLEHVWITCPNDTEYKNNLCGCLQDILYGKNLTIIFQVLLFLIFGSTLFSTSKGCMWQQLHRLDK